MKNDDERAFELWLMDSPDASNEDQLADWLKADPDNMRQFVKANIRDQMLRDAAKSEFVADEIREVPSVCPEPIRHRNKGQVFRMAAAIAAVAAVFLVTIFWFWDRGPERQTLKPFSSIAMVQGISSNLKVGDRLGNESVEIESGIVRLLFDDGVEVTLQGPAHYMLIAPGKTRLLSGLLTATVPPGAEGFRVETPSAEVVDLGTAFGIEQRPDGSSQVSVFDGEVEVVGQKDSDKYLLTEGETIQVAVDGEVSESKFASAQFEKLWPVASGISGSTGAFQFAPQWPRMLKRIESDTKIFVLPEGYAKVLEQPCQIDMDGNGLNASDIPAGKRVRSFLLQFNPVDSGKMPRGGRRNNRNNFRRIEGNITFERPVIGLIINTETLKKTDGQFSLNRAGGLFGRGLEFKPPRMADEISLSDDRRTLTLNLGVVNRLSDHVRVIVDAQIDKIPSTTFLEEK